VPITPFHFGAGAALHAAAPRQVSLLAFIAANCITDCETIYNVLSGRFPLHRFLHTFVGATVTAIVTVALFFALRTLAARVELPNGFDWQKLTIAPVAVGAGLGTYSHIVLDGIMHADVRPFGPWRDDNPFFGLVALDALHLGCLAAGALGLLVIFVRNARRKDD
jgi:membrane-bound metal-dependent hydrolase YbcI (DUF457 family)